MTNTSKFKGIVNTDEDSHFTGREIVQEGGENDEVEEKELEASEETGSEEETSSTGETESTEDDDAELLPQFKGKSKKEISKSYSELLKEHGRQGQEVGELRKAAREWLFNESRNAKDNRKEKLTDEDFMERPSDAVKSVVEDSLEPIKEQLELANRRAAMNDLLRKHPDFNKVVTDSNFQEWVQGSPYRQKLFERGDQYDFDATDELISLYKDSKAVAESQVTKTDKQKNLKKVATESNGAPSGGGKGKKKVWSSAQLIHLKITNPSKYNELQPEIMAAYAEGRVK